MHSPKPPAFFSAATCAVAMALCLPLPVSARQDSQQEKPAAAAAKSKATEKKSESAPPAPSPEQELQSAIDAAANNRAALLRNLEAYLQKYPDTPRRPQIYRALVEASLQLRDEPKAAYYAERIVALSPEDMSITLLAIQLLEKQGDEPALRRAVNYATRVLEFVGKSSTADKSPRVSPAEWEKEKQRDELSLLTLRGRLWMK